MSTSGKGFAPLSNTGVPVSQSKPQVEIGLDYVAGSFPGDKLTDVRILVEQVTRSRFSDEYSPVRWFHRCYRTPDSTCLYSHPRSPGQNHGALVLPGKVLAALSPSDCRFLVIELSLLGFKPTRLDVRIDDFTKTLTPNLVKEAFERHDITGFNLKTEATLIKNIVRGRSLGETIYIGKRGKNGSGKFIRCYTKWIESKGQIDSNRFEIEFTENYAKDLFSVLISMELSSWVEVMIACVTGAVDFIDRQSPDGIRKDVANCPRLTWWEFVVGDIPRIRLSRPRKEKTIKKAIKWIEKQVLPTLAMVLSYFARKHGSNMDEIFWEAWQRGDSRMSDVHRGILASSLGEI